MNELLSWFGFLVNIAVVIGFVVVAAMSAKRIGGAGPWLLAGVGVIDGLLIVVFRLYRLVSAPHWPDPTFQILQILDALAMYGSGFLALVGMLFLYPKPRV